MAERYKSLFSKYSTNLTLSALAVLVVAAGAFALQSKMGGNQSLAAAASANAQNAESARRIEQACVDAKGKVNKNFYLFSTFTPSAKTLSETMTIKTGKKFEDTCTAIPPDTYVGGKGLFGGLTCVGVALKIIIKEDGTVQKTSAPDKAMPAGTCDVLACDRRGSATTGCAHVKKPGGISADEALALPNPESSLSKELAQNGAYQFFHEKNLPQAFPNIEKQAVGAQSSVGQWFTELFGQESAQQELVRRSVDIAALIQKFGVEDNSIPTGASRPNAVPPGNELKDKQDITPPPPTEKAPDIAANPRENSGDTFSAPSPSQAKQCSFQFLRQLLGFPCTP
jgi:hypothetical protein